MFLSLRLAAALIAHYFSSVVRVCLWMRVGAAARNDFMVSRRWPREAMLVMNVAMLWIKLAG